MSSEDSTPVAVIESPVVSVVPEVPVALPKGNGLSVFVNDGREVVVGAYNKVMNVYNSVVARTEKFRTTGDAHFRSTMVTFHEHRHKHPWTMIFGGSLLGATMMIPFGRGAVLRAAVSSGLLSLCLVNPEYVYDLYKNKFESKHK